MQICNQIYIIFMELIVYILVYPFLWILSRLPLRVLYVFSDIIYFVLYYIIGYRKQVVSNNLKLAFPEKSEQEILNIQKKFYAHFVDIFTEMIKSFSISKDEIAKRYTFENVELIQDLEKKHFNKSVVLLGSHYANWEWIFSLDRYAKRAGYGAYTRINNSYFNTKIKSTRERFNSHLIETFNFIKAINTNEKNNVKGYYGLLSDQSPQLSRTHDWGEFLGIHVPIHTGAEMICKRFNFIAVSFLTTKIKRGHYRTSFKLISENPKQMEHLEITKIYLADLEKHIRRTPEYYFWSHKRFKHMDKSPLKTS